jgi:hypothetical protein
VTDVKGPIHFLTVTPKKGKDTEILLQFLDPNIFGEEMATTLRSQIGNNSLIFKVDNCKSTV